MKILVTGGAGFIGSHIVDAYIKIGHRVSIIDNLATGTRKNLNPAAKFYKMDIRNKAVVEQIVKRERPEIINHHAAIAQITVSLRNPIETLEANVIGTVNLIRALGEYGKGKNRKIIFSSTGGAMYGTPKKLPAPETVRPNPVSPYGLSKLMAEEAIKFYAEYYNINYTIFRYANVYGPRQNPKGEAGIVAIFGALMEQGEQPTIFGDGTKVRDYVHVSDVIRANVAALKKGNGETMNIGWGKAVTDREMFEALAAATGFTGKPHYAPYRKGEVYRISLDPSRARKILGWKPEIKLKNGVAKTIAKL